MLNVKTDNSIFFSPNLFSPHSDSADWESRKFKKSLIFFIFLSYKKIADFWLETFPV